MNKLEKRMNDIFESLEREIGYAHDEHSRVALLAFQAALYAWQKRYAPHWAIQYRESNGCSSIDVVRPQSQAIYHFGWMPFQIVNERRSRPGQFTWLFPEVEPLQELRRIVSLVAGMPDLYNGWTEFDLPPIGAHFRSKSPMI